MNYEISTDRQKLTLTVDKEERQQLREMENIHADDSLHEFSERFIGNCELEWVSPEETGDLTNAPMLGIYGKDSKKPFGRYAGRWADKKGVVCDWYQPVVERWAFMDYQVRSLLQDLLENGKAVLTA